jgi:hypothetical protein
MATEGILSLPQLWKSLPHLLLLRTLELPKMDSKPGYSTRPLGSSANSGRYWDLEHHYYYLVGMPTVVYLAHPDVPWVDRPPDGAKDI